jgi:hypothetical protein
MFKQSRKLVGYQNTFPQVATNEKKITKHLDKHQTKQTKQPNTNQKKQPKHKKPLCHKVYLQYHTNQTLKNPYKQRKILKHTTQNNQFMAQIIHYFANIVLVEPQNIKFSMQTNTEESPE